MKLSLLLGAALLACGFPAFGRTLVTRRDVVGLNADPSWWKGVGSWRSDLPISPPSSITPPDANNDLAIDSSPFSVAFGNSVESDKPPGLPDIQPEFLPPYGFDTNSLSIEPSLMIASAIPEDLRAKLKSMKNKENKFCIYELSRDQKSLEFKECEPENYDRPEDKTWMRFYQKFFFSNPGFALYRLANGELLFIRKIHDEGCEFMLPKRPCPDYDGILAGFQRQWINWIRTVFPKVHIEANDVTLNDLWDQIRTRYGIPSPN
ncbi:hypothetical protein MMC22_009625 [Lobaria immixta]|nr:hypothetical protein [Lobaria immixta]